MPPFLIVLSLAVALVSACGGTYVYMEARNARKIQEEERRAGEESFRLALGREIREKRKQFVFEDLVERIGLPREDADRVALDLFRDLSERVVEDGVITSDERHKLDVFARLLEIEPSTAARIEQGAKDRHYRSAVSGVLADGRIGEEEAHRLKSLRASLAIDDDRSRALAGEVSRDAYLVAFRRIASDGVITRAESEELARYRDALAISDVEAMSIIRQEALNLYRRRFAEVVQDGEVTAQEERDLDWLRHETGLTDDDLLLYGERLREVKRLAELRKGNLPSVRTAKLLEGGESCYWDGPCVHVYQTPTRQKVASGELVVTSKRIMFIGADKNFTFAPSKIMDISVYRDALQVKTTGKAGAGSYHVDRPDELEAIFTGLAKKHKFLLSENYSSKKTRHIPDSVKREVWDRDGGRCVRCSAADYLEFDHIIPHSQGGANTVGNVQLLCRRCNGEKSDRI